MNSQTQGAYTNEMDPTQSSTLAAGQPYTTTETTTTTHTSRTPHHSTGTTAGPIGTSSGAVGGERVQSGQGLMGKVKQISTTIDGGLNSLRGRGLEVLDNAMGDQQGAEKDRAIQEKGLAEIRERSFHPSSTTAPSTSGMTGQGSMTGTGGLAGTGAGGVVGYEERVPAGSSGDRRNAAMHDTSMGRQI